MIDDSTASRLLIEHVGCVDSTNSELMRREPLLAVESKAAALWLVAARQTAGRGRRQRRWLATPEASLTASFAREVQEVPHLGALSLVAGVAIAETLAGFGVEVRLKWPNDIHVAGGKAGGILCEARARGPATRIVIGCGLNLTLPAGAIDRDQAVAGLFDRSDWSDRERLCVALGRALLDATDQFLAEGFGAFRQRWRLRDMLQGRAIVIHDYEVAGAMTAATARGIDDDGALLVEIGHSGERRRVFAEEVSVRSLS